MRKLSILASLAAAAVIFTACGGGGGGGGYVPPPAPPPEPVYDVLYLDSDFGPVSGVSYDCTSASGWTDIDGSFLFLAGDVCTFNLAGFNGTIFDWDPLYISYADGSGVMDIPYECWSGTGGWTLIDGSFDYDVDDVCDFYF